MLVAVAAIACVNLGDDTAVTVWETQLSPEIGYPDLSGQAAAVSRSDGTSIGIGIDGAEPGAQHVWSMGLGTCATPGQQIGSDADYPELVVGVTGHAESETHLGSRLSRGGAYHVAVQLSAMDASPVACGDLVAR